MTSKFTAIPPPLLLHPNPSLACHTLRSTSPPSFACHKPSARSPGLASSLACTLSVICLVNTGNSVGSCISYLEYPPIETRCLSSDPLQPDTRIRQNPYPSVRVRVS